MVSLGVSEKEPPKGSGKVFDCPCCGARAHHTEHTTSKSIHFVGDRSITELPICKDIAGDSAHVFSATKCDGCGCISYWRNNTMIYPAQNTAPPADADMPDNVREIYDEAAQVAHASPRAAAALLRLALEKLFVHLEAEGDTLYKQVTYLQEEKGLSPMIVKAMELVRVGGNNAVHAKPGVIDSADTAETAQKTFSIINLIVDALITQPREIAQLYEERVPDTQKRDFGKDA